MKKVFLTIDIFIKYILVLLIATVSVLGFYQVMMRYVFNNSSSWSEEAIRFLFVWASCIGGAIGVKEHIHIGIDAVVNHLSAAPKKVIEILVLVLLCVFGIFIFKFGMDLTIKTSLQRSPALRLPMSYVYSAVPVLGILTSYFSICEIIQNVHLKKEG
ncbi:MAG: TRAP transporter small permease [Lachnospiraceae bacterium]|nr:TRAP transporter small permease [Lachnospiraceae bacterium]